MSIIIIDYDAGNVKSLQFALNKLGVNSILSNDPEKISSADKVIFPGQGQASSAMVKLKNKGLDKVIPNLKQPLLGICLGMQLLCLKTKEGNTEGLGIIKINVEKFPDSVKVPQMGWNTVSHSSRNLFKGIKQDTYMYLVHSYYVPLIHETSAQSFYSLNYSVAIEKNNFYGVQFHPEKSSADGLLLLENFLKL